MQRAEERDRAHDGDAGERRNVNARRDLDAAAERRRHRHEAAAEDHADQVLHHDGDAERGDEHGEERALVALDRRVDEAVHGDAEQHGRRRRHQGCRQPAGARDRRQIIEEISRDRERRAVREVEDAGGAENQREPGRRERIQRAQLDSVDEELQQEHGNLVAA
jgi:hypothetical protein